MKLTTLQWLCMSASLLVMVGLVLDLADVVNLPAAYFVILIPVAMVTHWVLPSMKEINRAYRRKS